MSLDALTTRYDAALPDTRLADPPNADGDPVQHQGEGPRGQAGGRASQSDHAAFQASGREAFAVLVHAGPASTPQQSPAVQARAGAPQYEAPPQPARVLYTDQSMWLLGKAALQQNALDPGQARLHAEIARVLVGSAGDGAPLRLNGYGLAALGLAAGVRPEALRILHLDAAARFVNAATDATHQQDRLRGVLDAAQAAPAMTPPQPTTQEMKQELRALLGLPEKAFKKMGDAQIAAKYNEVMAALEAGGDFKMKFGKYKVSFSVDDSGQITACKVKKKGLFGGVFSAIGDFFGKFGKTLLTVCSFIPIPWISIPARIISGVIAVVEGVKSGNVLQVVAGAANAVVGGAGALAGKAVSGVAASVANVAGKVRDVAQGAQAAIAAFQRGGVNGIVSGVLQAASTVAGVAGDAAGGVANVARGVQQWADRVLVGEQVVVDIKNGRIFDAVGNAAGLAGTVAADLGAGDRVIQVTGEIQAAAGYGSDAIATVQAVLRGDVQGALTSGAGFATGLDAAFGTDIAAQFDASNGWIGAAGNWIGHGTEALRVVQQIGSGRVDLALASASQLAATIEWDIAIGTVFDVDQAGWDDYRDGVHETIEVWAGLAADGARVVELVRGGDFDTAFDAAIALANDATAQVAPGTTLFDPQAGWVESTGRLLEYTEEVVAVIGDLGDGRTDAALDRAARLLLDAGVDFGAGEGTAGELILAHAGTWAGFGADAVRLAAHVQARDVDAIAYGAFDLAIDLGGYVDAAEAVALGDAPAWTAIARLHGGNVVDAGLEARRAIDSRDVVAMARAAQALCDAVRETISAASGREAPLAKAA
ncbi:hypothetical protein H0E84_04405 [Luteimonas sp. SJ-92]|uniref:Uncharacterized protein n=1 Tax=Luteimonas salinisoli TaxID=2752307 RepID=A0A853J9T5_9GAMM|nr:hypothetical protein [Luteimonas salinisoli]NZA25615.1 hypothetical protein [Luteimonas salinisoli]